MAVTTSLLLAVALGATGAGRAGAPGRLAPLPHEQAVSTHGPYEMGACNACHDLKDPAGLPGRLLKPSNKLCFDCHDDYLKPMKGHPAPDDPCTTCHSPHNAKKKKLLLK
ncbi:MAG TPA: cytochrome c3 family protein [Anaeromyxobacteraceae bacterium]